MLRCGSLRAAAQERLDGRAGLQALRQRLPALSGAARRECADFLRALRPVSVPCRRIALPCRDARSARAGAEFLARLTCRSAQDGRPDAEAARASRSSISERVHAAAHAGRRVSAGGRRLASAGVQCARTHRYLAGFGVSVRDADHGEGHQGRRGRAGYQEREERGAKTIVHFCYRLKVRPVETAIYIANPARALQPHETKILRLRDDLSSGRSRAFAAVESGILKAACVISHSGATCRRLSRTRPSRRAAPS